MNMEPHNIPGMPTGTPEAGGGGGGGGGIDDDTALSTSPGAVKRRGTVACRRCRRLRSKCIHQHSYPPCEACRLAGIQAAAECSFPQRGEKDLDRQFRRRPIPTIDTPRAGNEYVSADAVRQNVPSNLSSPPSGLSGSSRQSVESSLEVPRSLTFSIPTGQEDMFPSTDEIVEGCRVFVTSYFQLGFIPKAVFLENLCQDTSSVPKFLLATILSISARFTPSLIRRYGTARKATDHFLEVSRSMVPEEMYKPSLERIQGFFLLAISQWGNGERDRSSMDMGVAVRMAALLKLHCEESYILDRNSSADQVVRSESARRIFWMIQSQENLHSGYNTPAPFPMEDITTLLPCDETDFAFGVIPTERAAVPGTPPAIANIQLVYSPTRCLFATLIQAHELWGQVARRARRTDQAVNNAPPWDPTSDFQKTLSDLRYWEETLPPKHQFSVWNLRGWKAEALDLSFLSVTMVLRLSNIVSRRVYLDDMLSTLTDEPIDQPLEPSTPTMANANDKAAPSYPTPTSNLRDSFLPAAPNGFWAQVSNELFMNVWQMHEQGDAYFKMRAVDEGFPQILIFCVYMCGSLASYLWRYPALSPQLADRAENMAQRSLEVLSALHAAWPTSSSWQRGLQQIATPLTEIGPSDEREMVAPAQQFDIKPGTLSVNIPPAVQENPPPLFQPAGQVVPTAPEGVLGEMINVLPNAPNHQARFGSMQMNPLPNELFDAELAAFLQGDFHYDLLDGWGQPGAAG